MKCSTNNCLRKLVVILSCIAIMITIFPGKVKASGYPIAYFCSDEDFKTYTSRVTVNEGDIYPIRINWIAEFQNEGYELHIYDNSGKEVSKSEETWYNSSHFMHITIDWNTKGYKPGTYKVELTKQFYSLYRWNEAPEKEYLTVDLTGSQVDLSKVSGLKVKNSSKKTALVRFYEVDEANKYKVQYSLDKTFRTGVKSRTTTKTSYKIKGLKKGKTYYVRVCAMNDDNLGEWSAVKKVKIRK